MWFGRTGLNITLKFMKYATRRCEHGGQRQQNMYLFALCLVE